MVQYRDRITFSPAVLINLNPHKPTSMNVDHVLLGLHEDTLFVALIILYRAGHTSGMVIEI